MPEPILVEGLREAAQALKDLGSVEDTREFKAAGRTVAERVVIPAARGRAASLGRLFIRAADTLRATTTAAGAALRYGGGFGGAMGAEFGADRNQERLVRVAGGGTTYRKGWNQFRPWRGNSDTAGYFLFPTIRDDEADIIAGYESELEPLFRRIGGE